MPSEYHIEMAEAERRGYLCACESIANVALKCARHCLAAQDEAGAIALTDFAEAIVVGIKQAIDEEGRGDK